MSTVMAEHPAESRAGTPRSPELELHGSWLVAVLLFSSLCIAVGLLWDISWHMSIGRDTLWSPPHVLEQIGAGLAGLACGAVVLITTFGGSLAQRGNAVRFWGFRGPMGGWIAIWGALAMIFSVPFDDWWHNAYGLDVEILSPPHIVLLLGMIAIQVGAMILALGQQNRRDGTRARRFSVAYVLAAGSLIAMVGIAISEYTMLPNLWRDPVMYRVAAIAFPIFLVAVARAGRLRFPATAAATAYMAIFLLTQWVLVQFPATPRLSPIVRPLTRMAAYGFPLLLIVPSLGMDLTLRKWNRIGEWKLAGMLGLMFVVLMIAVHWPFSAFLIHSPLAQNDVFLARHWPYFSAPGSWQTSYFGASDGGLFGADFAIGMVAAIVFAVLSARLGLSWGAWMKKVRR